MKKSVVLTTLLILMMLVTSCSAVLEKYYTPMEEGSTQEVIFEVPSGASTSGIASSLQEEGLIQNANAFKLKVREMDVDGRMKAGTYLLSPGMDVETIINKLVQGDIYIETHRFTIPEGFEVRQIVDLLEEKGIADRERLIDVLENHPFDYAFLEGVDRQYLLEGFLFPDTYEISKTADEVALVRMLLNRFDSVFVDSYYARAEELNLSILEVVTLASIIEREARLQEEFPVISSVFHNRIEIGMLLQSCATVQFVLGERKDRLTYADLEIESRFNTYKYVGLTPGPIASPGALAIESALYPETTRYLYFATTERNDGSHYFNETLAGHERDAAKGKNQ